MTLFTGSSKVAEKLAVDLKGRIKLEDAGFDWKILGPDVNEVSLVSCKYYLLSTQFFCGSRLISNHLFWFLSVR